MIDWDFVIQSQIAPAIKMIAKDLAEAVRIRRAIGAKREGEDHHSAKRGKQTKVAGETDWKYTSVAAMCEGNYDVKPAESGSGRAMRKGFFGMAANNYNLIADLCDTYVPADFDIPFFVSEAKKTTGEVLELMSGTGRVSIPLLEAGVRLTCVDLAGELNAILEAKLKRKGLKAGIYTMDVCELQLPQKFAMIIIPFHSFAHIVSPDDQRKALSRIHQHLLPGGTFICTLGNPAVRRQAVDGQLRLFRKYPLEDGQGSLLLWIKEDLHANDSQVVEALQFFEEYDAKGVLTSKRLLELHFRLSRKDELETLAKAAGFGVKALYGDYAYAEFREDTSPFMIWLFESHGLV